MQSTMHSEFGIVEFFQESLILERTGWISAALRKTGEALQNVCQQQ